jgi:hypothetical protein
MKASTLRLALAAALGLGLAGGVLWLTTMSPKSPRHRPTTERSAERTAQAAVAEEPAPQVSSARSQQVRDLVAMIQSVLRSPKPSAQDTQGVLSLPADDPRKKAYLDDTFIRSEAGRLLQKYADLFRQLGLDADGIERMTGLMIGAQLLSREVSAYTRATEVRAEVSYVPVAWGGLEALATRGNTADLSDLIKRRTEARAPVEAEILSLLGQENYTLYQNRLAAEPAVNVVENYHDRLTSAGVAGLNQTQTTQLLAVVLAEQTPLSGLYRMDRITDNIVQAARTFLDPVQQQVLERVYWENKQLDDAIVAAVEAQRRENAAAGK